MRQYLFPTASQRFAFLRPPELRLILPSRWTVALYAAVLLFLGCTVGALRAQETAPPPPTPRGGLQVRSVSAYFNYYSAALPSAGGLQPSTKLLPDAAGGASVQVGWGKFSERTTSSFTYTSSLTGHVRYSEWNAWNHALSLTTSHKLAPRWTFGFSAAWRLQQPGAVLVFAYHAQQCHVCPVYLR